jgi:hypothetical protein
MGNLDASPDFASAMRSHFSQTNGRSGDEGKRFYWETVRLKPISETAIKAAKNAVILELVDPLSFCYY